MEERKRGEARKILFLDFDRQLSETGKVSTADAGKRLGIKLGTCSSAFITWKSMRGFIIGGDRHKIMGLVKKPEYKRFHQIATGEELKTDSVIAQNDTTPVPDTVDPMLMPLPVTDLSTLTAEQIVDAIVTVKSKLDDTLKWYKLFEQDNARMSSEIIKLREDNAKLKAKLAEYENKFTRVVSLKIQNENTELSMDAHALKG